MQNEGFMAPSRRIGPSRLFAERLVDSRLGSIVSFELGPFWGGVNEAIIEKMGTLFASTSYYEVSLRQNDLFSASIQETGRGLGQFECNLVTETWRETTL
jgi:hypothetical protein